jgi:capsular polysaccharide biosynthesis protein
MLSLCSQLVGLDLIVHQDPAIELHHDVVFRPFDPTLWLADPGWGIYFTDGQLLQAAAYRRLPRGDLVGQSYNLNLTKDAWSSVVGEYIYGGPIIPHYGHFLTAALPRFWHIVRYGVPDVPIICHSIESPEEWFARPYVSTILGRLGLSPAHFAHFREPTLLPRLRVARPSFEEQFFAHPVFREIGRAVSSTLSLSQRNRGPLYISKAKLGPGATYRLMNESKLEESISQAGIRVIYPETLTLDEQIAEIASASVLLGTVGSAFHTTLFSPSPKRIIGLAYQSALNSNYILIDKLVGNESLYVYPDSDIKPQESAAITFAYKVDRADEVAKAFLALI